MKKVNKKGFTLIELIIVATIMVMVMGAILNFIRPMNKFYERTQNMDDTNDICSILMDNVDDQLRYATNLIVLQDYQGVPQLSDGFLVDSSGHPSFKAKLTDVLIIDNDHVRGSQLAGYDAQGTVAHRKGARGCILRARINDAGIDIDNMNILRSEDLYNDYGCTFDASLQVSENGKSKCLTIDMDLRRPTREGLNYVFKKVGASQVRDFELVNINLDEASNKNMNASFYSSRANALNTIDYNSFVQSSNTGGSNHLEADGTYTYIFYTKEKPSTEEVKISLRSEYPSGAAVGSPIPLTSGSSIPDYIYNQWMDWGKSHQKIDSTNGTFMHFDGITSASGEPLEYYQSAPITSNMTFYCQYSPQTLSTPTGYFKFIDKFNEPHEDVESSGGFVEQAPFYSVADGFNGTVEFRDGYGDDPKVGAYKFIGWNTNSSVTGPKPDDEDDAIAAGWFVKDHVYDYANPDPYYAIYEVKPTVNFNVAAPDDVPDFDTAIFGDISIRNDYTGDNYKDDDRLNTIIQYAKEKAPEGKVFENLHIIDSFGEDKGVLGEVSTEKLDPDQQYMIKPVYKECAYEGTYEVTITVESLSKNDGWNSFIIKPVEGSNTPVRFVLCDNNGAEIQKETATWHYSNPNYSEGQIFKLYIFDDSHAQIGFQNTFVEVDGNSAYVYDGIRIIKQ